MRKLLYSTLILTSIVSFTACNKWLDVNHDPNVIETISNAEVLLPAIEVGIGNNLMGWEFGFGGACWNEYWTQNLNASQFKSYCSYADEDFGTAYYSLTAQVLEDCNRAKVLAKKEGKDNLYYMAEALSIFTSQILTDVWGDIPYSEAMKGDEGISSPKYDKGQDIYKDLLKRLEQLQKMDLHSNLKFDAKYDFIYAGDMSKWQLFVNALGLKLRLRQSETSGYNNAEVLSYIQSHELLVKSAKISGSVWSNGEEGKRFPLLEFEEGGANNFTTNIIACKNFIGYLSVNKDPRLETLFNPSKDGDYVGAMFGDYESKEKSDGKTEDKAVNYSTVKLNPKSDLILMSDWEVQFYVAEVYARAGQYTEAKMAYDKAIEFSMKQHGIKSFDINDSAPKRYAFFDATSLPRALELIGTQKWIANANYQHIESFLERNRIKYPALYPIDIKLNRQDAYNDPQLLGHMTISVVGYNKLNKALPASPLYADSSISRNTNAMPQKKNIGQKVWWNTKPEVIVKGKLDGNVD